jgi:uncharacterized membrane protein
MDLLVLSYFCQPNSETALPIIRISLFVLLLLVLATGMRLYQIERAVLFTDEQRSLCVSNGFGAVTAASKEQTEQLIVNDSLPYSFDHNYLRNQRGPANIINASIALGGNFTFYYMITSAWTRIWGNSKLSLRSISLIFGVLTVILGYYFARQLFNPITATFAGILLSVQPWLVSYSKWGEAYMLVAFFSLMTTYSVYQIAVAKKHLWLHIPLYVVAMFLGAMSHYILIYVAMSHVLLVGFFHVHRKALWEFGTMLLVVAVALGFWFANGGMRGHHIMHQMGWGILHGQDAVASHPFSIVDFFGITRTIFGMPLFHELGLLAARILAALVFLVLSFFVFRNVAKSPYFRAIMFLIVPIACYLILATLSFSFYRSFTDAALATATIIMPLGTIYMAYGLERIYQSNQWGRITAFVIGILCFLHGLSNSYLLHTERSEYKGQALYDLEANTAFLKNYAMPGDTLVFPNITNAVVVNLVMEEKNQNLQIVNNQLSRDVLFEIRNGDKVFQYK